MADNYTAGNHDGCIAEMQARTERLAPLVAIRLNSRKSV
jgi:hypothetical protein